MIAELFALVAFVLPEWVFHRRFVKAVADAGVE